MIGASTAFLETLRVLERFALYDVPVIIEGETGTGKELAARALHYGGRRRDRPFVPVNCGAIPDALIENELFGHERGAFTDARGAQHGLIHAAHTGTLFLDEVESLSAKAQVALLRFLQDAQYRPLGSSRTEQADVRIVSATNASLDALVAVGAFRADLRYRLQILQVTMPPLRQRDGDAVLLAEHFVGKLSRRFGETNKALSRSSVAWFEHYAWPGNVRELENLVCRHYVLADTESIAIPPPGPISCAVPPGGTTQRFAPARARALAAFERSYIETLLERTHGNVTEAASLAGKERRALGKLIKKHHIDRVRFA